jgi:hypothetical protein
MRKIYAIQLSYDVSSEEKEQAEKALLCFEHTIKKLNVSIDYLDIMAIPFKDHPEIDPKEINEYRAALRRFRDKSIENFNDFKEAALKCVEMMSSFLSDTQVLKLVKLFISSIENIESGVNQLSALFNNLDSNTLITDMNKDIDEIKKKCEELKTVINERIEDHIKNNILGKTWMNGISDQIQLSVERKTPAIIDLYKQRQEQLKAASKSNRP